MRRLRWLRRSVQNLADGLGCRTERLAMDLLVGMILAGSVVLSRIARELHPAKRGFEACLERLSRGVGSSRARLKVIADRYLRRAGRHTWGEYDLITLDFSDLVKRWGRAMPFLAQVRDASETRWVGRRVIERG